MRIDEPRRLTTKLDLLLLAREKKALGHRYVQVVSFRVRSPDNWESVRILPSANGILYGRCVGELDAKHGMRRFLLDVRIDDIERTILPVLSPSGDEKP